MSITDLVIRKSKLALGLAGILLVSPITCGQNHGLPDSTQDSTYNNTNNTTGGTSNDNGSFDNESNYPTSGSNSSPNNNQSDGGSDLGSDDAYEEDYSTSTFFIDDPNPISLATSTIGSYADYEVSIGADYGGCPAHGCITSPGSRSTNEVDILAAVYVVVKDGVRAVSDLDTRVARDTAELNRAYSSMNVQFNTTYYSVTELNHPEWWDVTNSEFRDLINTVKNDDASPWWPIVYVHSINGGAHAGQAYQCSNRGIVLVRNAPIQTAVHEFGHQMCLYHTHEASCGAEECEGSGCDATGDFICDTLADRTYNSCSGSGCYKTCGDCVAPTENYMSYHGSCRTRFSETQLDVMKCWLNSW